MGSDDVRTIVLVDDAPDVRSLVRMRLRLTKRFDVVGEGATGEEGVRLAEELEPDLMLLDVSMPDMDGIDALVRIGEVSPRTCVLMFSGFEEHGLADRARELGAVDFIEKSLPIAQVVERLLAAVDAEPAPAPVAAEPEPILQEHLERFRAAFEQAAIGMATLTLTGRVVRANAAFEHMASAMPGGLVGVPFDDLVHEGHRRSVVSAFEEVATGARDSVAVEHGMADHRVVSTVAVVRDSAHAPLYLFLQVQDVSEPRAAQEELRRSEERFRLLVETVADYAIFMLDPEGHVATWNAGAERAKGYTADEIIGRHFSTFYLPDDIARAHPQYELSVAAAEGRYEEEGWRKRKDGSVFWANVVITALRDHDGELVGFAKVTRDVSERQRLLEQLEKAAADRAQLLAVTAHELRTPVAIVKGYASTLAAHWDVLEEQERREMVSSLDRTGNRLGRLVEDLFTAARLEAGGLDVVKAPFDLSEVLHEVAGDLSPSIEVHAKPVLVHADRGRAHQMVQNYLTNALRYGAPPITATCSSSDGMAELVVTDHGPGVADELVPNLFTKFAEGRSKEGTGLGLFIVRELARAQGGDAWHESPADAGARFWMTLPLAPTAT